MTGYERAYALMEEIFDNFCDDDKKWFMADPGAYELGPLGRHIRNYAKLWEDPWQPLLINGVDHSHDHPDAISARAIKNFRENKQREGV